MFRLCFILLIINLRTILKFKTTNTNKTTKDEYDLIQFS